MPIFGAPVVYHRSFRATLLDPLVIGDILVHRQVCQNSYEFIIVYPILHGDSTILLVQDFATIHQVYIHPINIR